MPEHRTAPHPEWVQMYRQGLTTSQIAATAGVGKSTVRYHLAIAAAAEPSIRDDHRNATRTPPVTRITADGLRNLDGTLALYRTEDRLPSSSSPSARERALAMWLTRRRQDHDRGTLSPTYSDALQEIPDWEQRTRTSNDESRWNQRLQELTAHMAAGNDWPRHKRTDTEEERVLGMWLHIQRMKYRCNELHQGKEAQLNTLLPGWRNGRTRGRPPGSQTPEKDALLDPGVDVVPEPSHAFHPFDAALGGFVPFPAAKTAHPGQYLESADDNTPCVPAVW